MLSSPGFKLEAGNRPGWAHARKHAVMRHPCRPGLHRKLPRSSRAATRQQRGWCAACATTAHVWKRPVPAESHPVLWLSVSTFVMSCSHTGLRPVLPLFAKGFGVGAAAVGSTISVFALARLICNLPAGHFADEWGRKPLLALGPLLTGAGMLGCGLARSFPVLLACRFLTGLGSALQMSGAQLYLADVSTVGNRARVMGLNQAANLLGSLAGPVLGGVLGEALSLRAPFVAAAAACLAAALYGAVCLPETMPLREGAGAGAGHRPRPQPAAPPVQAPRGALPSSPPAEPSERTTAPARPAWLQLLLNRDFGAAAFINGLIFMTMNGSRGVLVPLLANRKFGLTPSAVGVLFSSQAVISLLLTWPASWAADELGRKWTIVPSCVGLATALLVACAAGSEVGFLTAMVVFAASNACLGATPSAFAADLVRNTPCAGLGLGIYRSAGDVGLMFGPWLLGVLADVWSTQLALGFNAVLLLAATSFFALTAREPQRAKAS